MRAAVVAVGAAMFMTAGGVTVAAASSLGPASYAGRSAVVSSALPSRHGMLTQRPAATIPEGQSAARPSASPGLRYQSAGRVPAAAGDVSPPIVVSGPAARSGRVASESSTPVAAAAPDAPAHSNAANAAPPTVAAGLPPTPSPAPTAAPPASSAPAAAANPDPAITPTVYVGNPSGVLPDDSRSQCIFGPPDPKTGLRPVVGCDPHVTWIATYGPVDYAPVVSWRTVIYTLHATQQPGFAAGVTPAPVDSGMLFSAAAGCCEWPFFPLEYSLLPPGQYVAYVQVVAADGLTSIFAPSSFSIPKAV